MLTLCGQGLLEHAEHAWVLHLRDVEAHVAGGGAGDAEDVAGRQDDVVLQAAPRQVGGVDAARQAAPEVEPATRQQPGTDFQRYQPLREYCPSS